MPNTLNPTQLMTKHVHSPFVILLTLLSSLPLNGFFGRKMPIDPSIMILETNRAFRVRVLNDLQVQHGCWWLWEKSNCTFAAFYGGFGMTPF